MTLKDSRLLALSFALEIKGAFHLSQNSWNFGWYIKWNGLFRDMDQLWRWSTLTGPVISVGRTEMSLSIWQNCCPMHRSFVSCLQNNNQKRGGLDRVCATGMYLSIGHVEFPKFQTEIFVEWKAPCLSLVALKGKREKDNVKIMERRWPLSNSVSSIPPDFATASWQRGLNSLLVELRRASVEVREFSNLLA